MRRKFIAARCAHLLFTGTFPATRSRALFARHAEDDHLPSTVRETMLIGPLRGVVTRENARTTRRSVPTSLNARFLSLSLRPHPPF